MPERGAAGGRPHLAAGLIAFVATLAYVLPFRAYGLNLDDEGTLLYELLRVLRGDVPYVDFRTGYTPGYFYLSAGLWKLTGALPAFRATLGGVHALTACGLALLLAGLVRPALAVLVPLLYVAFIPVLPGEFCAFNVPYPAWFATLGWIATAGAMTAFVRRRRRALLAVAGIAAAVTFSMKPNAGVLVLGAALAALLLPDGDRSGAPAATRSGTPSAVVWYGLWAAVLAVVAVTLGGVPAPTDALVYLAPIALALAALPTASRVGRRGTFGDAAMLLGTFAAPTLPWLAYFVHRLGVRGFLREVLLVGSGAARLYYTPYPAFERWAVLVAALAIGVTLLGVLVRDRRVGLRLALGALVLAIGAGVAAIAGVAVMPERLVWSLIWQLESAAFPLTLLVHLAGACWLWRHRRDACAAAASVLLLFGMFMHLQLYPRADFMHLVGALPLTTAFAAVLLDRVLDWWQAGASGSWGRRGVGVVAAIVLGAVMLLRISPSVAALGTRPRFVLPFAVARVGVEATHAADLRSLAAASAALASRVPTGAATLGFPALDVALFLTGARNPTPYTYFFPGRPDHGEEAEVVDALAADAPAALVSVNRHFTFFDEAPPYYFLLRRFVRARYGLVARAGRYDVLAAVAGGRSAPADGHAVPDAPGEESVAASDLGALLQAATADDAAVRETAVRTVLSAVERRGGTGLEVDVAAQALDRRRQLLLLRAIRDARDARAASYLLSTARGADPRLIREALDAMERTRAELVARRYLWAGRFDVDAWPGRAALTDALRTALLDRDAPAPAVAFAAVVAGALGDAASEPALRARLAAGTPSAARSGVTPLADATSTASAALALVDLAPAHLGCALTPLLDRRDGAVVALVPALLLELLARDGGADVETRRCLGDVIAGGGAAAADAVWIAAALVDPSLVSVLRDASRSPDVAIRQAAVWGLGELPPTADTRAALASVRVEDADQVVRALTTATAKVEGRVPRALAAR
ncbi:MAG: hypothetical protein HY271_02485 [Deltaproteobacteria bacterium]|nr:hypothetical protein [Deltaproteobacteria bacterium]